MNIRSFVATLRLVDHSPTALWPTELVGDASEKWISVGQDLLRVCVLPRQTSAREAATLPSQPPAWRLGDDAECRTEPKATSLANAATIHYDPSDRNLTVYTSITGLPPVFLYADGCRVILASDIYLIAGLPDIHLELDPTGVAEFARFGHPLDHRTLYKNTTLLPSGARVVARHHAGVVVEQLWRVPEATPLKWDQFIDRQISAFTEAMRRIDLSRSFLSLTAGLDTRTVFAALADQQRLVPAATMTGVRLSVDARAAARLCRAYDVPHTRVIMDDRFTRNLPEYVLRASRLSGGLASVRQAAEVFFYDQLAGRFAARLSGNLGNQVGRGGTEGVGTRQAGIELVSPALRLEARPVKGHWLDLRQGGSAAIEFSLQQEYPFALAGNYCIGNHFAIQQSPYADRTLVETLSLKPGEPSASPSLLQRRLKDVRHRFVGEPLSMSFQRSLLNQLGGFAATEPINYGWRASGGVSIPGLMRGTAALLGMVAEKRRLDEGWFGGSVERLGLTDLHTFERPARWLRRDLREFTRDTLSSYAVRQSGIFDKTVLARVVEEHFAGRKDHHESVTFALDTALAHQLFCSTAARSPNLQSA